MSDATTLTVFQHPACGSSRPVAKEDGEPAIDADRNKTGRRVAS